MAFRSRAQLIATNGQTGTGTFSRNSAAQLRATNGVIPEPSMPHLPDVTAALAQFVEALKAYVTLATAQTITGLKTFNLGAAAPFAVDAASLLVANLNADKLDGKDEAAFAGIAEAETVSGLWTFNRGAAVPFAVDAASLLVTNLNADKWDGQDYSEGSFTVTGTGFTVNPTGTAYYIKMGKQVTLYLPLLTGTSNATTFTITGLDIAVRPTRDSYHQAFGQDNGVSLAYPAILSAASTTITLIPAVGAAANTWTAAGTKRFIYTTITYPLL